MLNKNRKQIINRKNEFDNYQRLRKNITFLNMNIDNNILENLVNENEIDNTDTIKNTNIINNKEKSRDKKIKKRLDKVTKIVTKSNDIIIKDKKIDKIITYLILILLWI